MHALRSSAVSGLKSLNAIKAQPHLGPDHPSYPADAGCSSEFRDRCTTSATSPYAYLAHASDLSDCAAPIGNAMIGVPLFTRPSLPEASSTAT